MGGDKIGFFVNPGQNREASTLGGQGISVVAYSDKQDAALEYIKWFAQPSVQKKWWDLGGYSCHVSVLSDPSFPDSAPFASDFLLAMDNVMDFWQEPLTPNCCWRCKNAFMIMWLPTRAPHRKRSTS